MRFLYLGTNLPLLIHPTHFRRLHTTRIILSEKRRHPPIICYWLIYNFVPCLQDDHEFGQITVRKHSRQIVAIYDRFGRLIRGNLSKPKTVLEYVVFERHMRPLQWGSEWRIHSKIVPEKSTAVSTHNLQVDFRTNIVPDSFG